MKPVEDMNSLKNALRDVADEEKLAYNWSRIEEKRHRRPIVSDRFVPAAAVLVFAVAVVAAIFVFKPESGNAPKPLLLTLSEWTPVIDVPSYASKEKRVLLSDGSCLTLAPGAALEVKEDSPQRFETALLKGWVRFSVTPGMGRTWDIDVGVGHIVVLGTQFTVSRTKDAVKVTVHRGTVALTEAYAARETMKISAGESRLLAFPGAPVRVAHIDEASDERLSLSRSLSPSKPTKLSAERERPTAKTPNRPTSKSTHTGGPGLGFQTTDLAGLSSSDTVNSLLKQVDDARRHGRNDEAARLLERLLKDYPDDPVFGLAALTLGRIRLDALHRPRSAALAFKKATEFKGLPSPLREQAYAGCVDAFHLAGDDNAALSMKNLYKSRFPGGTWLQWMEQRINVEN